MIVVVNSHFVQFQAPILWTSWAKSFNRSIMLEFDVGQTKRRKKSLVQKGMSHAQYLQDILGMNCEAEGPSSIPEMLAYPRQIFDHFVNPDVSGGQASFNLTFNISCKVFFVFLNLLLSGSCRELEVIGWQLCLQYAQSLHWEGDMRLSGYLSQPCVQRCRMGC